MTSEALSADLVPAPAAARLGRRTLGLANGKRIAAPPGGGHHPTIAIIGAGFSGTLLTLHLLRRCPDARVLLIERNAQFGRGLAYATGNPSHLLNVPAGRMSAFHDRPGDFVDWLAQEAESAPGVAAFHDGSFVPRQLFGAYVRHLLNRELKSGDAARLELLRGEVTGIAEGRDITLTLTLDRGRQVAVDLAVLGIGNFPPEPPAVADPWIYDTDFYRGDPWSGDTLGELEPDAPVLLIGTGLTMVDVVVSLLDRGHTGPIHALSRRGLVPQCHATGALPVALPAAPLPPTISGLTRFLRAEVDDAVAAGGSWHGVVDALRPITQGLWASLAPAERLRFLRHVRPWWDIHRHRMPPEIARRIDEIRRCGRLRILAGRIAAYRAAGREVEVEYRAPRPAEPRRLRVARVINCSGPGCDFDRIRDPLIQGMLRAGQARPDPLRLGLDVTPHGALKHRDGAVSRRVYAMGPVTKGAFWEIIAVPDIRRQCELLATHLGQVTAALQLQYASAAAAPA